MKDKGLYKKLLTIVAPIAFQYFMSSLVSASDAFMLGFLNQDSLSAVSLAGQVAFVYGFFIYAFVSGCNVLAAQYWGKKDTKTVGEVLAVTMRYSLVVGAVFTLAALIVPCSIMRFFTNDSELIRLGGIYLRVVALSYILGGFSQGYFGIMKVCDLAGLSSLIGSLAVVLNIALNAVFIFGIGPFPEMGIAGAALATVITRAFECVFILVVMIRGKCPRLSVKKKERIKYLKIVTHVQKDRYESIVTICAVKNLK